MTKSYIKISYEKRRRLSVPMPFYHTFLEISDKGKITKWGYYSLTDSLWLLSLLIPVPGEVRVDTHNADYSIVLSEEQKKVRKVLKLIKSKKYNWKVYMALFKNCFDWRNAVLKAAGIKYPTKDWFWKK